MNPNTWMTIEQLCEELDISRSTFDDWRRKGNAPRMIQLPSRKYRISTTSSCLRQNRSHYRSMEPTHTPLATTARIILGHTLTTHAASFDDLHPTAFFFGDDGNTTSMMSDTNPYASLLRIGEEPFPLSASGIGLIHCGRVAPTSEFAPSESPDRKRIVCVCVPDQSHF
jgi:hypothetical protein